MIAKTSKRASKKAAKRGSKGKAKTASKKANLTRSKKSRKQGKQSEPDLSWHPMFLRTYAKTGNVLASCKAAGVTRPTFYDHLQKYPDFQLKVDDAKEDAIDILEAAARKRGLRSSDALIKFLLQSLRPETYRETIRNQHSGSVAIDVSQLTDDELRAIAQG